MILAQRIKTIMSLIMSLLQSELEVALASAGLTTLPVLPWYTPPPPLGPQPTANAVLTSERWKNVHKPQVLCRPTCNVFKR